jgi:hypothetical protein
VVGRLLVAAALAAVPVIAAAQAPIAAVRDGAVKVAFPEQILLRRDVRKQLASALTTTFVITTRVRAPARSGRSQIEVRFDLWDEVYLVKRVELGRVVDRRRLASFDELRQWWTSPIRVIDNAAAGAALDIEMSVLPFSIAEEGDARDWLRKSGGVGTDQSPVDGVVGAMIGTTIQARPIATFRWTIAVIAERR